MARVSKRKKTVGKIETQKERNVLKTAIYARLSSDAKDNSSESIEMQVHIAEDFIKSFNDKGGNVRLEVFDRYMDLGRSGTNFDRDEFSRLMQDIRLGDVKCVVVKDLSRFARNYIETGNYIERIFPFLGVRFISVSDGLDTWAEGQEKQQLTSEIKNLVNDMYAKDFSRKAELSHKQRREQGHYIGGYAPYGYRSIMEDGIRRLYPDDKTKGIVVFIYETFIEVKSYAGVLEAIRERKINSINVYDRTGEVYFSGAGKYVGWNTISVKNVLTSEVYRGNLALGKRENLKIRDTKGKRVPKEEWTWHYGTHENIVSEELIKETDLVLKEIAEQTKAKRKIMPEHGEMENVFAGVIFCGLCGKEMVRNIRCREHADGTGRILESYSCPKDGKSNNNGCTKPNNLAKLKLLDLLVPMIKTEFSLYLSEPAGLLDTVDEVCRERQKQLEQDIRHMERICHDNSEALGNLYISLREKSIDESRYKELKKDREDNLRKAKDIIAEKEAKLKETKKHAKQCKRQLRAMMKLNDGEALDREMVSALIERIDVYPGRQIEVTFNYSAYEGGLK